jgi:hypothetical protein
VESCGEQKIKKKSPFDYVMKLSTYFERQIVMETLILYHFKDDDDDENNNNNFISVLTTADSQKFRP